MKFDRFEDIVAWQKAGALTIETYRLLAGCRDFGFIDQIRRAVVSIMNNIAEGFERRSNNEFKHFLYISKGSCGEYRSMLYIAVRLGYIPPEKFKQLLKQSTEISKMLSGLIKTL